MIVSVFDVLRRGVLVLFNHRPIYPKKKKTNFFSFIVRISKIEFKNWKGIDFGEV
jgi:hypothetical protein